MAALVSSDEVVRDTVPASSVAMAVSKAGVVMERVPDGGAGAWADPSTGRVAVGTTEQGSQADLRTALNSAGVDDVDIEVVEHSQAVLDSIVENVYAAPGMESVSSAMHDYAKNAVVLTSSVPITDELRKAIYANYGDAAVLDKVSSIR